MSRVASDYFSDSVVCIGILRPLREIKIRVFLFLTQRPQRAQSFIYLSYFTLALEWSQTSLRQECAESFIHPLPPAGYSRLSQGEKRTPPQLVRASHWGVLPSRGTEAHSVLLLKTSLAPDGREWLQPICAHISRTLYTPPLWRGWGRVRWGAGWFPSSSTICLCGLCRA